MMARAGSMHLASLGSLRAGRRLGLAALGRRAVAAPASTTPPLLMTSGAQALSVQGKHALVWRSRHGRAHEQEGRKGGRVAGAVAGPTPPSSGRDISSSAAPRHGEMDAAHGTARRSIAANCNRRAEKR